MGMQKAAGDGDFSNKNSKGFTRNSSPSRGKGEKGSTANGLHRTSKANAMKNASTGGGSYGGAGHKGH